MARACPLWVLLGVLVVGPVTAWSAEPDIIARVNGEPVTRSEVQRLLTDPRARRQLQQELGVPKPDSAALQRLAVRKLITQHLLLQEAGRRDITVSQEELSRALVALRRRFKDLKSFGMWLKAQGLDDISLHAALRAQMATVRVMAALVAGVQLTEEQVQAYYAAHQDELKIDEQVGLRVIAVQEKAAAEELIAAVRRGEDFDRLAQEHSLDVRAAPGDAIGWISTQTLPPALREVVDALKAGETGGPVQSGAEFLLVRLEERRPMRTMSLPEVRATIEQYLLTAKQQEVVQAWLTAQEQQAKIEVFP